MNNGLMLIGRLTEDPVVKETESGKKVCSLRIAVPRSFKNANGEYETDFFDCNIWNSIADNAAEYCRKGDMVGIKARLQNRTYEKDGIKQYTNDIQVERLTFLTSSINKTDEKKTEAEEIDKKI